MDEQQQQRKVIQRTAPKGNEKSAVKKNVINEHYLWLFLNNG